MIKKKFDKMVEDDVAYVQLQENFERARRISEEKDKEIKELQQKRDDDYRGKVVLFDTFVQERLDLLGRIHRIEQRIHALGFAVPTTVPKLTMYPGKTESPTVKLAAAFDEVVHQWKISKEE
jgi:hypothetical protein